MGQGWRLRAACRPPADISDADRKAWTDRWFPQDEPGSNGLSSESRQAFREAVHICNTVCPVKRECAEFVREARLYDGVWAGMHGRPLRNWIRGDKRRINARESVR